MPVRGRSHDCFGGDISAGPRPVLDHERLTKPLRQPLSQQARGSVRPAAGGLPDNDARYGIGTAAGGKADDDADRPRRIGLRPRDARHGRERGSARGQMQKISAGKFHGIAP